MGGSGSIFSASNREGMLNAKGDHLLFLSDDDALGYEFIDKASDPLESNVACVPFTGSLIDKDFAVGTDIEPECVVHKMILDLSWRTAEN